MEIILRVPNPKYDAGQKMLLDINNRFTYHKPVEGQLDRYNALRDTAKTFATMIAELVPSGREQAVAITKIEEAVMWANAGIARNEK